MEAAPGCPFAPSPDERKSAHLATGNGPAGAWVRGFEAGRAVLRDRHARQAGFRAEEIGRAKGITRPPIILLDGEAHRHQRSSTARFFTPKVVASRYRPVIEETTDLLIDRLVRNGRADLDALSLELAVKVAADVVGLTSSDVIGMSRRLDAMVSSGNEPAGNSLSRAARWVRAQLRVLRFYWHDVRPAIAARRREPREDVISHLLSEGYAPLEILTECITYGVAGMITTREFITMAGWHLLERPALAATFLSADWAGKQKILEEILRIDPVVAALFRRVDGGIVGIDIRSANLDTTAFGECPMQIDPDRTRAPKVGAPGLSFGDGEHRCPGADLAMHESAIFLDRLLRISGLRLERAPRLGWNGLIMGYESRGCQLAIG